MSETEWARGNYLVTLECRSALTGRLHRARFTEAPPMSGESVWCYSCERMSTVIHANHEGRTRCLDCAYDRRGHLGMGVATGRAISHVQHHSGHRVRVTVGARLVRTITEEFLAEISA